MSQVNAGSVVQVDIENNAECLAEIVVFPDGFGRVEQDDIETVFPQETFHASQHRGIVIDHENGFLISQVNIPQAETANISQRSSAANNFVSQIRFRDRFSYCPLGQAVRSETGH